MFELPELITKAADCPQSWIRNTEIVDLWAKEQTYNLHNMNWFQMPEGDLILSLSDNRRLRIPCQDELGNTVINGQKVPMQQALDRAFDYVSNNCEDEKYLWDLSLVNRWGKDKASDRQLEIIQKRFPDFDMENLTKGQASQILNRLFGGKKR